MTSARRTPSNSTESRRLNHQLATLGRTLELLRSVDVRDDCDEPYVVVQNLGHPQADFPNKSADPSTFRLSFNFAGPTGQGVDDSAILALDSGAVTPPAQCHRR